MLISDITRGDEVHFDAMFLDENDLLIVPSMVMVWINYMFDGARVQTSVDFSQQSDGSFFAVWDSGVADVGTVHWCIKTKNPTSADQGNFRLVANLANERDY